MGPFERHVREAIELNRLRAPLYADASAGVSLRISQRLIRRERLLLPVARWFDRRARRYHDAGIPLMEELFVPMAGAPAFVARAPTVSASLAPPDPRRLRRALRSAVRAGGLVAAARGIEAELQTLAADPGCWCMLRHLLESAHRVASLAGPHTDRALRSGLPSPLWIHRLLFHLHLAALGSATDLDSLALPLQREGIPILCRDLPPIGPS